VPLKPVPVSRARSSLRERPRQRAARPARHRVRPVDSVLVIGATWPPHQAPPRLPRRRRHSPRVHHITASRTRVALTCIYTAHTMHSRHRLPLAARFHSNAHAPADTFLVPARSPRKTRPSRRHPRLVRPMVRPTSIMRTTAPRSPPAKALRTMSRLRCAQSLHECGQKAARSQSFPRGRMWPPRHDRPCLHPLRGMFTPRSRALRMS
jgi:hypothetical protein